MQQFKYSFLSLLRNKTLTFWTLLFPLILGTFFNLAFSNIISSTESFTEIPVAVVVQGDSYFTEVLNELSGGEGALIVPQYLSAQEAEELLSTGEVDGIFEVGESIRLIVSKDGINQSILKSISDSYLQISGTISTIAQTKPDMIAVVLNTIYEDVNINRETTMGTGETDTMIQYYFALIAMSCLFGSYFGCQNIFNIQANRSPIAARRCTAPTKKISMIFTDFAAAVTLMFCISLIVLAYLILVLKINFGDTFWLVALTAFIGSITGVSLGMFVTALIQSSDENLPIGILTGVSLFLSFLSGLMFHTMRYIVEQYAPIINRINPAALLSDAFYSLVVYDSFTRYAASIISLLVLSAVFCVGSALLLRRKRYADL